MSYDPLGIDEPQQAQGEYDPLALDKRPLLDSHNSNKVKEPLWVKAADWFTGHFDQKQPEPEINAQGGSNLDKVESAEMPFSQDPITAASAGAASGVRSGVAAGVREGVGWLTGGASEIPSLAKGIATGASKLFKKNAAKSHLIDKAKEVVSNPMPQDQGKGKIVQEMNDAIGTTNAAQIPEGTTVPMPEKYVEQSGDVTYLASKNASAGQIGRKGTTEKPYRVTALVKGQPTPEHIGAESMDEATNVIKGITGADKEATQLPRSYAGQRFMKGLSMETNSVYPNRNNVPNVFKATDSLKANQQSIAAAEKAQEDTVAEIAKIAKDDSIPKSVKQERITSFAQKRQVLADEIDSKSFYKDEANPFSVDKNKAIQDTVGNANAGTAKDIVSMAHDKGLHYGAVIDDVGNMRFNVKDPLGHGGTFNSLREANDYIRMYGEKQTMANSNRAVDMVRNRTVAEAPELVKSPEVREAEAEAKAYIGKPRKTGEVRPEAPRTVTPEETYRLESPSVQTPPQPLLEPTGAAPGFSKWFEPFRFVAQDIETRTGFPLFTKYYEATQNGLLHENISLEPYMKRLRQAQKGVGNSASAKNIYHIMESPTFRESADFKDFAGKIKGTPLDGISEAEYNAAGKIRGILNDAAGEYGIPIDRMVQDYAPRMMREGVYSWKEAINNWKLPEEFKWAANEERTGYLNPHDENIFRVTDSYLRRGARHFYNGSNIEELSKAANEAKFHPADGKQIKAYADTLRGIPTSVDQTLQRTGEILGSKVNKLINNVAHIFGSEGSRRYDNVRFVRQDIEKVTGEKYPVYKKVGEEPGFFDTYNFGRDLVNAHLKLSYAGALAWRPVVFLRDAGQGMLSMPITGVRSFAKAHAMLGSPEAWHEAKAAGALLDAPVVAGGEMNKTWSVADDVLRVSTFDVTAGHNIGRFITYHAMKDNILREGAKYRQAVEGITDEAKLAKAREHFINNSGCDFFHELIQKNEIHPLLKADDIESLAERMALHATQETQWLYRKGNAPIWARSTVGRVFGQFGVWPSWYIEYAKNLATRGTKFNRAKRVAMLTAGYATMYETGKEVFGVDLHNWMYSHPLTWNPIPAALKQNIGAMVSGSDYDKARARQSLENTALMHIPFYISVKSMLKAQDEYENEDKVKRFLGFKPVQEE